MTLLPLAYPGMLLFCTYTCIVHAKVPSPVATFMGDSERELPVPADCPAAIELRALLDGEVRYVGDVHQVRSLVPARLELVDRLLGALSV